MISSFQHHCKRTRSLLICLTIPFFMDSAAFAAANDPAVYDQSKTAITVTKLQPVFMIKLVSNPTTGYTWLLRDYDKSMITPVKHQYHASQTRLVGAPGYDVWTFRVKPAAFLVPQRTSLHLIYARPWEDDKSASVAAFEISTEPS